MAAHWSDASEDVLMLLAERPTFSVADRLRLGAVRKSWRAATAITFPGTCLPYLLVPDGGGEEAERGARDESKDSGADGRLCNLFCPFDNKLYRGLRFSKSFTQSRYFDSCYSWLAMVDLDGQTCLLNPMSGAQVELPALSTFPDIIDVIDFPGGADGGNSEVGGGCGRRFMYVFDQLEPDGKPFGYDNVEMRDSYMTKMCLSSSDPLSDPNCIVMVIYGEMCHLAFAKPGEKAWTALLTPCSVLQDIIYHKGKFYAVNHGGTVVVVDFGDDFNSARVRKVALPPDAHKGQRKYLVGLPSGELLLVARKVDCVIDPYQTVNFGVLKIDFSSAQPEWVRVKSLGEWALFLGYSSSMAISSSQVSGRCRGNCIYFTDDYLDGYYEQPFGGHDMGIFDMETRSIERFYPCESQLIMPPPVWIWPRTQ